MDQVVRGVKLNCNISDAKYWGFFSICGLLMRLRDLYRSEHSLKPWEPVDRGEIGEWISHKEEEWKELQDADFIEVSTPAGRCVPFDAEKINEYLRSAGLIYGAGYGLYLKPTFFIADLISCREVEGRIVYIARNEHARDLFSSPGMLQGNTIFVRLDPLKALLWEKYSEARSKHNSCTLSAFERYGIDPCSDSEDRLEERLDALTEAYSETVLRHEVAESIEDIPEWSDMLLHCSDRHGEYFLRQVKDIIADTSEHGAIKYLIDRQDAEFLCLYVSSLGPHHGKMCPETKEALMRFLATGDWALMEEARKRAYTKFVSLSRQLADAYAVRADEETFFSQMREHMKIQ